MARAQVTITLEDDGSVTVNGPLQDKILMYGLLGAARDVVVDYAHQSANRVMLAPGPLAPSQH